MSIVVVLRKSPSYHPLRAKNLSGSRPILRSEREHRPQHRRNSVFLLCVKCRHPTISPRLLHTVLEAVIPGSKRVPVYWRAILSEFLMPCVPFLSPLRRQDTESIAIAWYFPCSDSFSLGLNYYNSRISRILSNQKIAGKCGVNLAVYGMALFGGRLLRTLTRPVSTYLPLLHFFTLHSSPAALKRQQPAEIPPKWLVRLQN